MRHTGVLQWLIETMKVVRGDVALRYCVTSTFVSLLGVLTAAFSCRTAIPSPK